MGNVIPFDGVVCEGEGMVNQSSLTGEPLPVLKKAGGFSVIGISIAGGVCHNIGQLVVVMIVVETFAMSYYMPVLLVAGLITGFLIGVVADQVLRRISDIMFLE